MKQIIIENVHNPILFRSPKTGKLNTVTNTGWKEVPEGTTLGQISRKSGQVSFVPKIITVKSSRNPKMIYTIRQYGTRYECNCPGFQFRKNCKHITEQKYAK